jgi:hypothetical protein
VGGARGSDVVVFGGGSAGSRGAMVHLEYVRDWVRPNPKHSFSVIGHLDSPLWVDVEPFSNASSDAWPSDRLTTIQLTRNARADSVGHAGRLCAAKYGTDLNSSDPEQVNAWRCYFGEYRLGLIDPSIPYLLIASQNDQFMLSMNLGHKPLTEEEFLYAEKLATRTREDVERLPNEAGSEHRAPRAVLSWRCYNHATSLRFEGFRRFTCPRLEDQSIRITMWGALENLIKRVVNSSGRSLESTNSWELYVDICTGFACGKGC